MADVKISGLPASTTPLTGAEILPVVQSGVTKQVSVTNLTAGRSISTTGYQLGGAGVLTEAGTTRTLSATDDGKVIYCTSGSAITITTASGLGAGFSCLVIQGGAGQITFAQGGGTTLVSYASLVKTAGQYAAASIVCPAADTFVLAGNLGV
jgi:hypothetical protein